MKLDLKKPEVIAVIAVIFAIVLFVIYKIFFEKKSSQTDTSKQTEQTDTSEQTEQIPIINTTYDLIKHYSSPSIEQFTNDREISNNREITELFTIFQKKLPNGLKNLIICDDHLLLLNDSTRIYNIINCVKGQMFHWWTKNMYSNSQNPDIINMDDLNLIMLITILLPIMIDENKTIRKIMEVTTFTGNIKDAFITIYNEKLTKLLKEHKQDTGITLLESAIEPAVPVGSLHAPKPNTQVISMMKFHAIFKQYMVKQQDFIKEVCNCKNVNIRLIK